MTSRDEKTLIESYASFPRGAQELSAARLAQNVASTLNRAFQASGRTARQLAESLGLTEGAVSQVLNGDGNIRVATIGRYLRAMGYEARLELAVVDPDLASPPPVGRRSRRVPPAQQGEDRAPRDVRASISMSRCNVTDGDVVAQALVLVLSHETPSAEDQRGESREGKTWHVLDRSFSSFADPRRAVQSAWRTEHRHASQQEHRLVRPGK